MQRIIDLSKGYLPIISVISLLTCVATIVWMLASAMTTLNVQAKQIDSIPNSYVSKSEFNATIKSMTDSLIRIDNNIQSINQTLLKYKFDVN